LSACRHSIDLLKGTATAKLDTWQATHEAIGNLVPLADELRKEWSSASVQRFRRAKEELARQVDELIRDCDRLEERWVAHQRVFHVKRLGERARRLRDQIEQATLDNWGEIQISF
jgi:hypothetical protein